MPFPFSDLSQAKVRPAVCLSDVDRGDWILCQITSNRYGNSKAIILEQHDFVHGGLAVTSYARPGKLFTANEDIIIRSLGALSPTTYRSLISAVLQIIHPTAIP